MKFHNYATFNCQGLNSDIKKSNLADDFLSLKITVMMLQETRIKNQGVHRITFSNGTTLLLYNSGHQTKSYAGTGFLVRADATATFQHISERIGILKATLNKTKYVFISAYAPTNESTIKDPDKTKDCYQSISNIINIIGKKDMVIIDGDFNAKVKMFNKDPTLDEILGKYAKSRINENGENLIELCNLHDLRITNTFFKHKPIHQTTWQSPIQYKNKIDSRTNKPRKNPYRNQIDYILVRNTKKINITDSKSTTNKITLFSDYKHKNCVA